MFFNLCLVGLNSIKVCHRLFKFIYVIFIWFLIYISLVSPQSRFVKSLFNISYLFIIVFIFYVLLYLNNLFVFICSCCDQARVISSPNYPNRKEPFCDPTWNRWSKLKQPNLCQFPSRSRLKTNNKWYVKVRKTFQVKSDKVLTAKFSGIWP